MYKTTGMRSAFTLIEIMVVVAIIGIIASLALPRMVKRKPSLEWSHVAQELNNTIYFARQQAISNQKNYRLVFNAPRQGAHSVAVEVEGPNPEKPGETHFAQARSEYFHGAYELAEELTIHAVWRGKTEQLAENKNKGFCYVIPNGLVQDVIIHMRRNDAKGEAKASFVVEPFFGRFEYVSGYVKLGHRDEEE